MQRWCGIDWAEHHHDVAIIDETGILDTKARIDDDAAGFTQLGPARRAWSGLRDADPGGPRDRQGPAAGEPARGRGAGVRDQPAVGARYRDRYAPSRSKSDAADALVLANIMRTDTAVHRLIPNDTELAASICVRARAHQDAIWDRQQTVGKLRSVLREYYPAFVATFEELSSREARATLLLAPSPEAGRRLRRPDARMARR